MVQLRWSPRTLTMPPTAWRRSRILPAGRSPTRATRWAARRRLTAQAAGRQRAVPVLASVGYQPFGPVNALTFGNGIAETRSFDLDYRMTSLADTGAAALQNLTYTYDAANNVPSITDGVTATNSQTLGYDALNRLTSAAGGYGSLRLHLRQRRQPAEPERGRRAHDLLLYGEEQPASAVTAGGMTQPVGYDKAGNVSHSPHDRHYNQAGRLAAVTAGGNPVAQYTYDAFGQRLVKVGAVSGTTLYQYDPHRPSARRNRRPGKSAGGLHLSRRPAGRDALARHRPGLLPARRPARHAAVGNRQRPERGLARQLRTVRRDERGSQPESCRICACPARSSMSTPDSITTASGTTRRGGEDICNPIRSGSCGGMNTYSYAGANPVNRTDPLGLLSLQDVKDAFSQVGDKISQEWQSLESFGQNVKADFEAGYQAGGISQGINDVINGLSAAGAPPCIVNAANDIRSLVQAAEQLAPIKDAYDFLNDVYDAGGGDAVPLINVLSKIGQWLQQNSDCWGNTCKPGIDPLKQPILNWDGAQPIPQAKPPAPAQPAAPAKPGS